MHHLHLFGDRGGGAGVQVAGQYLGNRDEFNATAKFWTECYAGKEGGADEKVTADPPKGPNLKR